MPTLRSTAYLALLFALLAGCGQEAQQETRQETPAATASEVETPSTDTGLAPHQQMARDFLKELIEIDTTDATGDNTAAAQAMADKLLAAGFPPEDVQVLGPVERKGNLVARYRGRDSVRKPLLLLVQAGACGQAGKPAEGLIVLEEALEGFEQRPTQGVVHCIALFGPIQRDPPHAGNGILDLDRRFVHGVALSPCVRDAPAIRSRGRSARRSRVVGDGLPRQESR